VTVNLISWLSPWRIGKINGRNNLSELLGSSIYAIVQSNTVVLWVALAAPGATITPLVSVVHMYCTLRKACIIGYFGSDVLGHHYHDR